MPTTHLYLPLTYLLPTDPTLTDSPRLPLAIDPPKNKSILLWFKADCLYVRWFIGLKVVSLRLQKAKARQRVGAGNRWACSNSISWHLGVCCTAAFFENQVSCCLCFFPWAWSSIIDNNWFCSLPTRNPWGLADCVPVYPISSLTMTSTLVFSQLMPTKKLTR